MNRVSLALVLGGGVIPAFAGAYELPVVDVDQNCLHELDNTSYPKEFKDKHANECVHDEQEAYNSLKAGAWAELSDNGQQYCLRTPRNSRGFYQVMLECVHMMRIDDINKEEFARRKNIQQNKQSFKP